MSFRTNLFCSVMLAMLLAVVIHPSANSYEITRGYISVERPWARASIGTSRPAAAYLTIRNNGRVADVLLGIETAAAGMTEIHEVVMTDGVARMGLVGQIPVGAGDTIELKPGGLHAMLMKLQKPLKKGENFTMSLIFKKAGRVDVAVPVMGVGASGPE